MLCLRRVSCPNGHGPNGASVGPPGVWDLHDCSEGSVWMTWSDPRGANPEACPNGWLGPSQCVAGNCDSCPSGHQTGQFFQHSRMVAAVFNSPE